MPVVNLPDGSRINFPDGTPPAEMNAAIEQHLGATKAAPSPERSDVDQGIHRASQFSRGFNQSVIDTAAALPDLVGSGLRAIGLPSSAPGYYKKTLEDLGNKVGMSVGDQAPAPEDTTDKVLRGAGAGVGNAAGMAVPAAGIARLAAPASRTAMLAEALAAQPTAQAVSGAVGGGVEGATDSPAAGLAAALATPSLGNLGRRAITPVTNHLSGEEQRLAQLAEQHGIQLTPGQATGSRPLQAMDSVLGTLPFSAGMQDRLATGQRQSFNKAVMSQAGVGADNASPQTMEKAFDDIGSRFDDLAAKTTVTPDSKLLQDVQDVAIEHIRRLPTDVQPVVGSYLQDITNLTHSGQPVSGEAYQKIATDIKQRARQYQNSRPDLADSLRGIGDALDDALERSASTPGLRQEWQDARREYRNLLTVDKAMSGGTQGARNSGDVPFSSLTNAVRGMDRRGYARGRGDLNDLSRVGDFLADKIPNSGTPERTALMGMLRGTGGVAGLGAAASGVDPVTALVAALTTYGAPPALHGAMNSAAGRAYLTNQVLPGNIQNHRQLLAKILAAQSPRSDESR